MGSFFVDPWAKAIAVHPLTGDILTIHEDRVVSGNVLKIQQHNKDGEFVKSLVDFENIEEGSYDSTVTTHFCILSFDLEGNLLKEHLFPLESWPDRPREIACSGNYLYATNGLTILKINLSDEHLESIPVRHLLPWDIGRTTDIKCDQKGRVLLSSRVQNESDSVRSEIYRYDERSGEFEKVLESKEYQRIETGCCQQPSMFFDENGLFYLVTSLVESLEVFNPELDNIFSLDEPPIGDYGYPAWDVAAFDDYVYVLGFADVHVFRWE